MNIYEKIKNAMVSILNTNDEFVGSGTLVSLEGGIFILTAKHVIETAIEADIHQSNPQQVNVVLGFSKHKESITIKADDVANRLLVHNRLEYSLDIALIPINVNITNIPNLKFNNNLNYGTTVYLSGYSADIPLPFKKQDFNQYADWEHFKELYLTPPPLSIKKANVFCIVPIREDNELLFSIIYIDKPLFQGASGGGIFDENGDCIAVITESLWVQNKCKISDKYAKISHHQTSKKEEIVEIDMIAQIPSSAGTTIGLTYEWIQKRIIRNDFK